MNEPARFEYTEPDGSTVAVTMGREAGRRCFGSSSEIAAARPAAGSNQNCSPEGASSKEQIANSRRASFFIQPTPALAARLNAVTQQAADRISRRIETWLHWVLKEALCLDVSGMDLDELANLVQRRGYELCRTTTGSGNGKLTLMKDQQPTRHELHLWRPCHGDYNGPLDN
jgi:hypothetical protein